MKSSVSDPWILVTGFGPFAGVVENPSGVVAEALNGREIAGVTCRGLVLDVSYARSIEAIKHACADTLPKYMVLLGVARSATGLRAEHQAVNCASSALPDVDGVLGAGNALDPGSPPDRILSSSVAVDRLVQCLVDAGFEAYSSWDAGGYVCNALYYQALEWSDVPVVFVHVPPVGGEWSHQRITEGVSSLLRLWTTFS